MKNILLLISLFGFTQSYCQWNKFSEVLDNNLFDIESINENELIVVGTDLINDLTTGIVYHSLDRGASWDTIYYHEFISNLGRLHKVNVANSNTIYTTNSGNRIYKSIDGGSNWNTLTIPTLENGPAIDAIYFDNSEIGFVGNHYGEIFKTIDGGSNWERVYFDQPYKPIYDINCPTNTTCYARSSMPPKFLKSIDSGESWNAINLVPNTFLLGGMHAINKDTIVMVSSDALILRSIDGGENWDTIPSPIDSDFNDVYFIGNIGFAVGREEVIIKSSDFGGTWTVEHSNPGSSEWITAIHMTNSSTAFACSNLGSIYTLENSTSSIELLNETNKVNIYPNPFSNHFTIEFEVPKNGIIEIFNSQGQRLQRIELDFQNSIKFDMSNLNSNVFFISFIENGTNFKIARKVIKMK